VLEPSGGYEIQAVLALNAVHHQVALVHATRIKDFIKATGKRAKNDRLDAINIALFAQTMNPTPRACLDHKTHLKGMVASQKQNCSNSSIG
jgi:transposase